MQNPVAKEHNRWGQRSAWAEWPDVLWAVLFYY